MFWASREVLKPKPERRGFQYLPESHQMLMCQKSYYYIKTFFHSKTLEKLLQKVFISCTYNGTEKHVTCEHFENAASRAKTNVIAIMHVTGDDVRFYGGPGMLILKTAEPCINST